MLLFESFPSVTDDGMDIIDGMPASRPSCPDRSRKPWEG